MTLPDNFNADKYNTWWTDCMLAFSDVLLNSSTNSIKKMIDIIIDNGPKPKRRNEWTIYENEDILVRHTFMGFPSGDQEAVMMVTILKNGRALRLETGATPIPS